MNPLLIEDVCTRYPFDISMLIYEYARPDSQTPLGFRQDEYKGGLLSKLYVSNMDNTDFASLCAQLNIGPEDYDLSDVENNTLYILALTDGNASLIEYMYRERLKKFHMPWFCM